MKTASVLSSLLSPRSSCPVPHEGEARIDLAERTFYWHFWAERGNVVGDSATENEFGGALALPLEHTETNPTATAFPFCSFCCRRGKERR